MKICFVVQRYGEEVNGGAEAYARQVAEHMVSLGGHEVECATTCAVDYMTWKNEYPAGDTVLNGVTVHRFPNKRQRDPEKFSKLCGKILGNPNATRKEQEDWMRDQGPECPELVSWVKSKHDDFDCFIFVCYLYYSTYFALPGVADKAIFIPTAHEEAPIHLDIFNDMFDLPAGFYYNTVEEKELTNRLFPSSKDKPDNKGKGGVGVEVPENVDPDAFRKKFGIEGDFMLYVGRIDENKCCPELFTYFDEFRKRNKDLDIKLVLMGKEVIKVPKRDDIISLGFVSEEDKFSGIKASTFFILPSKFESLSIVVLESMKMGIPCLVSGECDVLKGHCLRSNAGLYYSGYYEFEGCVKYLLGNPEVREKMGRNGVSYVDRDYTWPELVRGYEDLITRVTGIS